MLLLLFLASKKKLKIIEKIKEHLLLLQVLVLFLKSAVIVSLLFWEVVFAMVGLVGKR